jgi:hypothetical protein
VTKLLEGSRFNPWSINTERCDSISEYLPVASGFSLDVNLGRRQSKRRKIQGQE